MRCNLQCDCKHIERCVIRRHLLWLKVNFEMFLLTTQKSWKPVLTSRNLVIDLSLERVFKIIQKSSLSEHDQDVGGQKMSQWIFNFFSLKFLNVSRYVRNIDRAIAIDGVNILGPGNVSTIW